MIPEKLLEIMKKDGVVAIATLGKDGPHMVNTWNSYVPSREQMRPNRALRGSNNALNRTR
jgi:hypothetical protein